MATVVAAKQIQKFIDIKYINGKWCFRIVTPHGQIFPAPRTYLTDKQISTEALVIFHKHLIAMVEDCVI